MIGLLRRKLLLGLAVSVASPAILGQAGKRPRRVAVAFMGNPEPTKAYLDAFVSGMGGLGYVQGRDYALDVQFAYGRPEHTPKVVGDLLRRDPEVLVLAGGQAVGVAKAATSTVPIVMSASEPVELGLIASLAQPGGNVTGLAAFPSNSRPGSS